MYNDFFHLREAPFSITPDPRFLYMSQLHQEALAHLLYGTGEEGGFVELTGEVGTGKTTLVRALLETHLEQVDVALILNPRLTAEEFVASVCDELGVQYPTPVVTLKPLIDALNRFLLQTHSEGRQTVLIVDEAQNLDTGVLEQVRLLTNLETSRHKLLRIILVGQPELQKVLARHDMRQLAQRITARYHLEPLDRSDVVGYVTHRLRVAGGDPDLFSAGALREIHRRSRGVPRLINVICDRALLGAYADGARTVSKAMVKKAAEEAMGRIQGSGTHGPRLVVILGFTLFLLMGIGIYLHLVGPRQLSTLLADRADIATTADTSEQAKSEQESSPVASPTTNDVGDGGPMTGEAPAQAMSEAQTGPVPTAPEPEEVAATAISSMDVLRPDPPQSSNGPHQKPEPAVFPRSTGDSADAVTTVPEAAAAAEVAAVAEVAYSPLIETLLGSVAMDLGDPRLMPVIEDLPVALVGYDVEQNSLFRSLYGLWGEPLENRSIEAPCTTAASMKMGCLEGDAQWSELRSWNRPAILELEGHDGKPQPVLLQGLTDTQAVIDYGEGPRRVEIEQLRTLWNGQATVLWKPRTTEVWMRKGTEGEPVQWLRRQLDISEGSDPLQHYPSDRFDEALEIRVRRFQAGHGLKADGVVGPRTMLFLNNLGPEINSPTLLPSADELPS